MDHPRPSADLKLQRSGRDPSALSSDLARWLATVLPGERADPTVVMHEGVDDNGMSAETLFLEAAWTEDGRQEAGRYVARVTPAAEDIPVFPEQALQDQFDTMRLVGELTDVPIPRLRWMEPTGSVIGTPFFLMDHVEGNIPRDVLPYNLGDNWLFDASPEDHRRLQDRTVEVIAKLHAIPDASSTFGFLTPRQGSAGDTLLVRNLARTKAWYEFAVPGVGTSSLVERGLAWLEANLPATGETVLSWGDARVGNIIYRDFVPVAVLDWEMAAIGPRELDVSWLISAHQVFESLAQMLELPGMPHFLREEDVRAVYEKASGVALGDLRWYHVYNAVRWCIVFMRTGARQIHFGEIERPEDTETLMHHRPMIVRLLDEVGA
jgi:aminoglycoside phosphotransferase (APT) family kinase protein